MTETEARKVLGRAITTSFAMMRRMRMALLMHSWNNTAEENERLKACEVLLKGRF
jgi:hypothetical protein